MELLESESVHQHRTYIPIWHHFPRYVLLNGWTEIEPYSPAGVNKSLNAKYTHKEHDEYMPLTQPFAAMGVRRKALIIPGYCLELPALQDDLKEDGTYLKIILPCMHSMLLLFGITTEVSFISNKYVM